MRKSTFFWRELYRMAPETVERCAGVWMLNGARAQIRQVFTEKMELEMRQTASQGGIPVDVAGDDEEPLEVTIAKGVDDIMAHLDATRQEERRIVLCVLLAGAMLLGLEFSPRTGVGFVGMAKRFKQGFKSDKS